MDSVTRLTRIYERFAAQGEPDPDDEFLPEEKIYNTRFKSLVGVMLSAQTQDSRTLRACVQLFEKVRSPQDVIDISLEDLTNLIRPVGMYNTKARNLKMMAQQLIDRHEGEVPETRDHLMALQGVGRKSTDIIMRFVFEEAAIAVDTHVHRLCNRLGVVTTKTYDKTAEILAEHTPDQYRWRAHEWLITHGKQVCKSRKPQCGSCMLTDLCDYHQSNQPVSP
jgi:endonuclease III